MNTKHTSLPWIVVIGDVIRSVEGERVADCETSKLSARPCPPGPVDEANAAFIVRACNSHDELVAVLKKVALFGENIDSLSIGYVAALAELGRNASAALAKAKG